MGDTIVIGGKRCTARITFAAAWWLLVYGLALSAGPAVAQEELPIVARVGPWPVISQLVGYGERLWFANSVKGRNHNSADIYSYDPISGEVRYERHLFSQDAGDPLVAGGLLYWPFEDSRFSLGWGEFLVTDGRDWRWGRIPSARSFHTHALAAAGGVLVAATSAWRAGLQVSEDAGRSWRQIYDHPTPERRVSRIVSLAAVGDRVFGVLVTRRGQRLLILEGETVSEVPDWPRNRPILGLAPFRGRLYGLVQEADGVAPLLSDGAASRRLAAPRADWPVIDLAADGDGLWALSVDQDGGRLWFSREGARWAAAGRLAGGRPHELAVYGGRVYVSGAGADGRGILWGPPPPSPAEPRAEIATPLWRSPHHADDRIDPAPIDRVLLDPASYRDRTLLRDLLHRAARGRLPPDFFAERLAWPLPDARQSLIGGNVEVPAATLGRWLLLWGLAVAGEGRVPTRLLAEPWAEPANRSEKYFAAPPAAMWAAGLIGQDDRATLDALVGRLARPDEPLWLQGEAVGALSALTDRRFGYDPAAWRAWWAEARAGWRE